MTVSVDTVLLNESQRIKEMYNQNPKVDLISLTCSCYEYSMLGKCCSHLQRYARWFVIDKYDRFKVHRVNLIDFTCTCSPHTTILSKRCHHIDDMCAKIARKCRSHKSHERLHVRANSSQTPSQVSSETLPCTHYPSRVTCSSSNTDSIETMLTHLTIQPNATTRKRTNEEPSGTCSRKENCLCDSCSLAYTLHKKLKFDPCVHELKNQIDHEP